MRRPEFRILSTRTAPAVQVGNQHNHAYLNRSSHNNSSDNPIEDFPVNGEWGSKASCLAQLGSTSERSVLFNLYMACVGYGLTPVA